MKTARAVQPNLGRQAKFKKKLDTFLRSFRNRILNEILLYLSDAGGLTEDASLTFRPDDPLDRARLRNIKERINRLVLRDPDRFRRNVDDFIARNMGNWIRTADRETRQIAEWYVKNLAADVSTAQKASLKAAGIPDSVFAYEMRQTRKHFFITPQAINELPGMVARHDEPHQQHHNIRADKYSLCLYGCLRRSWHVFADCGSPWTIFFIYGSTSSACGN